MNKRTSVSLAIATALLLAAAAAPAAEAKLKSCAKRGYSVAEKVGGTVVMTRPAKNNKKWSSEGRSILLCSRAWGRRIHMGSFGISWDGQVAYGAMSHSIRFVTWSTGISNNASGVSDDFVHRADLQTGKVTRWSIGSPSFETIVTKTAVDENGSVGWHLLSIGDKSSRSDIFLADDRVPRLVAENVAQHSVAFDTRDGLSKLVWPTTMTSGPFVPASGNVSYPKKPKRCGKSGYALDAKIGGTLVMQREVRGGIWDGPATRYYVCSQDYGKRVAVGTFGVHIDGQSCLNDHVLSGRFAAFVTGGGGNAGGCNTQAILLIDLKTGMKRRILGSDMPRYYSVSSIIVRDDGTVAWIAAADPLHREVWRANLTSTTKLAEGPEIDRLFLQFGLGDDPNRVAWATAVGSVNAR